MCNYSKNEIKNKFKNQKKSIAVVGLGFIGLPLSLAFASKGILVHGYDVDKKKIEQLKRGETPIYEPGIKDELLMALKKGFFVPFSNPEFLKNEDFIVVTVGTPINEKNEAELKYIKKSCRTIGKYLKKYSIVILKSTVPPLTTEEVVVPILEKESKLSCNEDFGVAFCPERTVEGQAFKEFFILPKIIGGTDRKTTELVGTVFSLLGGTIVPVSLPRVAEMAKLMDNTYRDVNIAIANQFARACNILGIDVIETITAANKDYSRNHILIPGPGVGGSCLTKDPYMLASLIKNKKDSLELFLKARKVNEDMPMMVVKRLGKLFTRNRLKIENGKIGILGVSFKKDTSDIRKTPAKKVGDILEKKGANLVMHDPFVENKSFRKLFPYAKKVDNVENAAKNSDCILILTEHGTYEQINWGKIAKLMSHKLIMDTRHIVDPLKLIKLGFDFEGIGRPRSFFDARREDSK